MSIEVIIYVGLIAALGVVVSIVRDLIVGRLRPEEEADELAGNDQVLLDKTRLERPRGFL
jgi:hypothetical protein